MNDAKDDEKNRVRLRSIFATNLSMFLIGQSSIEENKFLGDATETLVTVKYL